MCILEYNFRLKHSPYASQGTIVKLKIYLIMINLANVINSEGLGTFLSILEILFFIISWFLGAALSSHIAIRLGRKEGLWFFIGLVFPILSMFAVYFLGETEEAHRKRIIQEEEWRKQVDK